MKSTAFRPRMKYHPASFEAHVLLAVLANYAACVSQIQMADARGRRSPGSAKKRKAKLFARTRGRRMKAGR